MRTGGGLSLGNPLHLPLSENLHVYVLHEPYLEQETCHPTEIVKVKKLIS
jgi:hypothetical protein